MFTFNNHVGFVSTKVVIADFLLDYILKMQIGNLQLPDLSVSLQKAIAFEMSHQINLSEGHRGKQIDFVVPINEKSDLLAQIVSSFMSKPYKNLFETVNGKITVNQSENLGKINIAVIDANMHFPLDQVFNETKKHNISIVDYQVFLGTNELKEQARNQMIKFNTNQSPFFTIEELLKYYADNKMVSSFLYKSWMNKLLTK